MEPTDEPVEDLLFLMDSLPLEACPVSFTSAMKVKLYSEPVSERLFRMYYLSMACKAANLASPITGAPTPEPIYDTLLRNRLGGVDSNLVGYKDFLDSRMQ